VTPTRDAQPARHLAPATVATTVTLVPAGSEARRVALGEGLVRRLTASQAATIVEAPSARDGDAMPSAPTRRAACRVAVRISAGLWRG
jgi:hypothetical protein